MVRCKSWLASSLGVALLLSGCGSSSEPQSTGAEGQSAPASATSQGPGAVISEFLTAVRTGDDKRASELLTQVARQRTTEMEMVVAPPGSDTASFKVLESEIEGSEAQVGTDWTDLDGDGQPRTDRIVWLLRRETDGWRIHGMATRIFEDMAPIMLNFEDPEDMLRKQQQAEEEIARRDASFSTTGEGEPAEEATVR